MSSVVGGDGGLPGRRAVLGLDDEAHTARVAAVGHCRRYCSLRRGKTTVDTSLFNARCCNWRGEDERVLARLEVRGHIARGSGDNRSGPPNGSASENLSGPRASRFPWSLTVRVARIAHPVEFDDVANSAGFWVSVGGGGRASAGAPTSAATAGVEDPTESVREGQGDDQAG